MNECGWYMDVDNEETINEWAASFYLCRPFPFHRSRLVLLLYSVSRMAYPFTSFCSNRRNGLLVCDSVCSMVLVGEVRRSLTYSTLSI